MLVSAPVSTSEREAVRSADTVVVGGGTAGAAVAGLLASRGDRRVVVLEAGPDYGAFHGGRWPADLLDATDIPASHQWGFDSGQTYVDRVVPFERARVIGGCSAHNGCTALWGHRADYDGWAALGLAGWKADELLSVFRDVSERLGVRTYVPDELTPFQRAFLETAGAVGVPRVNDLNDLDGGVGVAPMPANVRDGVRWNASFAYLDPVRAGGDLTVIGDALVDKVLIRDGRVNGVAFVDPAGPAQIVCDEVVVAGGTYGSPTILLRSGIGPADELRALGIEPVVDRAGVGRNLHDHPAFELRFAASAELARETDAFAATRWHPAEQVVAKARSNAGDPFDLHVYPELSRDLGTPGGWRAVIPVACLTPRSRGAVRLRDRDPASAPAIDHRFLSESADVDVLADGLALVQEIVATEPLRSSLGERVAPRELPRNRSEAEELIRRQVVHYWHPVGTCRMGPESDADAVTDAHGRVRGIEGLRVADASLMPATVRATTNVPTLVIGEKIAASMGQR